jgi:hypothetical protein
MELMPLPSFIMSTLRRIVLLQTNSMQTGPAQAPIKRSYSVHNFAKLVSTFRSTHSALPGHFRNTTKIQEILTSLRILGTTFTYSQEQPFYDTWCNGPTTCTISNTKTVSYGFTVGGSLTGKFTDAVSAGVSGGFTTTQTTAKAQSYSTKIDKGTCGYFTYVPVKKETWCV